MGRLEKHLDPQTGPLAQFASELRDLRRLVGTPTYREMSRAAGYSPSALSAAASGASLPSTGVLSAYVKACGGDIEEWLAKRTAVGVVLAMPVAVPTPSATPIPLPETPRATPAPRMRQPWTRRFAGLLAAAVIGSLATVVPMAIWGAPACLTPDSGLPGPPAASCHAAPRS
jgi:hypothetical protein